MAQFNDWNNALNYQSVMVPNTPANYLPAVPVRQFSTSRVLPETPLLGSAPEAMQAEYQKLMSDTGGWSLGGLIDKIKGSGALGSYDAKTGVKTDGWGGLALGAVSSLANAYMGMQQYGLAKEQLAFQKDSFNKNYAANRQTINTQLEDRQRARVASNSGAYQSVGDYMNQNRIA